MRNVHYIFSKTVNKKCLYESFFFFFFSLSVFEVFTYNVINGYRNWELLAPWQGSKITVPTKFIAGDKDMGFESAGTKDYVRGDVFKSLVPNHEVVILDGHHFIHQEKAQQVSDEILSFIRKLSLD